MDFNRLKYFNYNLILISSVNIPTQHTKLSGQPIISQLLSFIPRELVDQAAETFKSDRYYKTMSTWKQLVFMFYGVVSKSNSLNSLCKCLLFWRIS